MATRYFGERIKRNEDPRLLTGQALFVDDVHLPGMAHAAFVRSPYAHARIVSIDVTRARQREGVIAVYTAADLGALLETGAAARLTAADQGHLLCRTHAGSVGQRHGAASRRSGGHGRRREPVHCRRCAE